MEQLEVFALPTMLFRGVEEHPWRTIAFMIHTVQISFLTLDAAVNPGIHIGWHNAAAGVEFFFALLLVAYHVIRIRAVWRTPFTALPTVMHCRRVVGCTSHESLDQDRPSLEYLQRRALWSLGASLLLQVSLVAVAAASLAEQRRPLEWAAFGLAVVWAIGTHGATDARVRTYFRRIHNLDLPSNPPSSWTMGGVLRSVLRQHWRAPREGGALVIVVVLVVLHAALTAFQGVATLWLMQAGTGYYVVQRAAASASESSVLEVHENDLCHWTGCSEESLALSVFGLLAAWFGAQAVGVLLDGLSAATILWWEVRVRDATVVRVADPTCPSGRRRSASRIYETDVAGAAELQYAALGLFVQSLVAVACWGVLATMDWGVAALCLALLPLLCMASGCTLTSPVPRQAPSEDSHTRTIRKAAVLLQWSLASTTDAATAESSAGGGMPPPSFRAVSSECLVELHRRDMLQPQRASVWRRLVYSDAAVDVFVHWYASLMGVAVLVRLAFDVADGRINEASSVAVLWLSGRVIGSVASVPDLVRRIASLAHTLCSVEALIYGRGDDDDDDDEAMRLSSGPNARTLVPWIRTAASVVLPLSTLDVTTTDSWLDGDQDEDENDDNHDECTEYCDNRDDVELPSNDGDGTCCSV